MYPSPSTHSQIIVCSFSVRVQKNLALSKDTPNINIYIYASIFISIFLFISIFMFMFIYTYIYIYILYYAVCVHTLTFVKGKFQHHTSIF